MALSKDFHDDGKTLTHLPSKLIYVHGFRIYALDAMARGEDPAAWIPLENEQAVTQVELHTNPPVAGSRQLTTGGMLVYTQKNGVKRSAAGAEILQCYKEIAALKTLETKTGPKP